MVGQFGKQLEHPLTFKGHYGLSAIAQFQEDSGQGGMEKVQPLLLTSMPRSLEEKREKARAP